MFRFLIILLSIHLGVVPALAQQSIIGGGVYGSAKTSASYQGPGDVNAGAVIMGSCARAYTAAFAATGAAICDLVDTATGASTCTLKIGANGFADVTSPVCLGNTVSVTTFCTITNPGGCSVTKVYDQTGNGNHEVQATLSLMPLLTLSAANGLPGLTCSSAAGSFLSASVTQAQPLSLSAVFEGTDTIGAISGVFTNNGGTFGLYAHTSVSQAALFGASASSLVLAAADNSYHAVQGILANGGTSTLAVDGSTNTGVLGTTGSTTLRVCKGSAALTGIVMEFSMYPSAWNSTQYGNMNANQHGTNGYNF